MDMNYGLVDPMEVFAAMTASLLEKQPVPFNPIYAIKPTPIPKLKIGGKPPREVFYRDTLTYMTKLPPPVQPKLCTCQYLCTGAPAAIICHSCSIYDPSRSAFYCERCFPVRHPWHRVPHLFTTIENDESIEHTFKIAHRVAEAKRYENEGKGILNRLRQNIPKLEYIADDEKVDNDVRAYGRRMVAVQEKLQELQAALRQDILHGDEHRRANMYSREGSAPAQPETNLLIENNSTDNTTNNSRTNKSRRKSSTSANSTITTTNNTSTTPGPLKLAELRNLPFFESEPLFTDLIEGESSPVLPQAPSQVRTPEVSLVQSIVPMYVPESELEELQIETEPAETTLPTIGDVNTSSIPNNSSTPKKGRMSFIRQDSTDSTGSMTISPMNDATHTAHGNSFFRENTIPELDTIIESVDNNINASADEAEHHDANNMNRYIDTFVNNYIEDDQVTDNAHNNDDLENNTPNADTIIDNLHNDTEATVAEHATDANHIDTTDTNHNNDATHIEYEQASSPGLKKILSGFSFTSVAHTDIDSVHSNSNHSNVSDDYNRYNAAHNNEDIPEHTSSELERYMNRSMHNSDLSTLSSSSVNIQRMFKGYIGRRTVSKMLTTRLVRVFSPEVGRDYYYDKVTGASMWEPPKQLQAEHIDELQYVAEATPTKIWACKRDCPRRKRERITRKVLAKIVITAFARCILARNRIRRRADEVYRRVWDADSSTYYYANVLTGETSWVKNKVYINPASEPPVYSDSGIADSMVDMNVLNVGSNKYGSSKKGSVKGSKRISPRVNRVY